MKLSKQTLLTIITEPVLENQMIELIKTKGARGFSIGSIRSETASDFSGSNIRIEIISNRSTAEKILENLQKNYFTKYSMIAFLSEIEVIRAEKFDAS